MAERIPIGFERWEPGHPWGDVIFSDSTRQSVQDPDGSIEQEAKSIATSFGAEGGAFTASSMLPPSRPAVGPSTQSAIGAAGETPPWVRAAMAESQDAVANAGPVTASGSARAAAGGVAGEKQPPVWIASAMGAQPTGAPPVPGTSENKAARVFAEQGMSPPQPAPQGPMASPTQPRRNPAEAAIAFVAPHLRPTAATVQTSGKDPVAADGVRAVNASALDLRGRSINEWQQAQHDTLTSQMQLERQAYGEGVARQFGAMGAEATQLRVKQEVAARKAAVAAEPIDPGRYLSTSGMRTALAIIGGVAGALAETTSTLSNSREKYKSTFVRDLLNIVDMDVASQREAKSSTLADLESKLGSAEAAVAYAQATAREALAQRLEAGQRFARTAEAYNTIGSAANEMRAQALSRHAQADALVMGDVSTSLQFSAPNPVAGSGSAPVNAETGEEQALLTANGTDSKRLAAYGAARLATGADGTIGVADDAEKAIAKLTAGQDVPGTGPIDKLFQPLLRGPDAAAVQQKLNMVNAQFTRAVSGAAATDAERAHLTKIIEGRGTLDDIKRGLTMVKAIAGRQLETLNASQSGEARAYEGIKGLRAGRQTLTAEQERRRTIQTAKRSGATGSFDDPPEAAAPEKPQANTPGGRNARGL